MLGTLIKLNIYKDKDIFLLTTLWRNKQTELLVCRIRSLESSSLQEQYSDQLNHVIKGFFSD